MTLIELNLAIVALLITPGPTNTLLALAGAEQGWRAALRLLPVELAAYICVVVPLCVLGAPLLQQLPVLRPVLTVVAALWVAGLAYGLWRRPSGLAPNRAQVTAVSVAVTTLLNPKGLIFGLVLIPAGPAMLPGLISFAVQVPLIAALWAGLGASLMARAGSWLTKAAALWLGVLALMLAVKVING